MLFLIECAMAKMVKSRTNQLELKNANHVRYCYLLFIIGIVLAVDMYK